MPDTNTSKPSRHSFQSLSIRDELEKLAWMQNPRMAGRLARRMASRTTGTGNRDNKARRTMRWQDRTLITLSAVLLTFLVTRTGSAIADEQQWGLQLTSDSGDYTQLAVNTDVQVDITGLIARVAVTQKFSNHGDQWAEGIYRFPLPQGTAVDRMRIKVGERILEGEIQEKVTARRVYERARENGQTATLVEQQRRNQFETRLANIGTDMAPALKTALALPEIPGLMRQVVFITDGAVGNESALLQRVAKDLGDSRMFTVAIGNAPNSWFMRKAAEIGRGSYVQIGKLDEVEQQMSALWDRIQIPALTDICVDWGEPAEYYPEIIPDLYAGEPLWLIARLPTQPTIISLCGEFNGRRWELTVNGWDAVNGSSGTDNLAILWARKKIEALEDGLMFGGDRELTQLEITDVALDFGLLTRYTSLVAVDRTPRRGIDEALTRTDVPGLLPAGTSSRLAGFPNTATGWRSQLLLSLFVLLLAFSLLWFSSSRLPMVKT